MEMEIRKIGWGELFDGIRELAKQVTMYAVDNDLYRYVWGMPSNGTIIAAMMPKVEPSLIPLPLVSNEQMAYTIVDDITDSGKTMLAFKGELQIWASVYQRLASPEADIYVEMVPVGTWLQFPWENDEATANDIEERS